MNGSRRWLAYALLGLGAGVGVNALLGPLAFRVIDYHFSTSLINQGIGLDAVVLIAVAPMAVLAGMMILRDHPAGPVVAFIPATFSAYMLPQYVVGPEYLELPGNNEQFFLFHVALFVVAVACIFGAWKSVDRTDLRPTSDRSDRIRSWVLFGVAGFVALGRWLPGIVDLLGGDPGIVDFTENPTSYLLIGVLDLGLVVPASVATAIALRRGAEWARTAAYALIGWFALVPASVAAMAITMQVKDDPNADPSMTIVFSVAAVAFTLGAAWLYRPMLTDPYAPQVKDLRAYLQ